MRLSSRFRIRDELLIIATRDTDNFSVLKKDGTYSELFGHIGFLIRNTLTRLNAR